MGENEKEIKKLTMDEINAAPAKERDKLFRDNGYKYDESPPTLPESGAWTEEQMKERIEKSKNSAPQYTIAELIELRNVELKLAGNDKQNGR